MISKGDIVRLFNPAHPKIAKLSHMHVVANTYDTKTCTERSFAICTSTPIRLIKENVPFMVVEERPFRKKTYIRMDPLYIVQNVKIKRESLTNPHRLSKEKEKEFFENINQAEQYKLCEQNFANLNSVYALPVT